MIIDFIIGLFYSLLSGFTSLLPDAAKPPEYIDTLYNQLNNFNYILPIKEMIMIAGLYVGFQGVRYLWRLIRLFLPGG